MRLIVTGMVVNSNYIGTSFSGSIQEFKSKVKNLFSFFKNIYINKYDITSHRVGNSKLKQLYINDFFDRKQIIEYLETELTGSLKETSNTENLAVAEE